MEDLSPASFHKLSQRILLDRSTCHLFRNHRVIGGPDVHGSCMVANGLDLEKGDEAKFCNYEERLDLYCQTVGTDYDEFYSCRQK